MTKKIEITKDGPYEVSDNVPLKNETIVSDVEGIAVGWEKGEKHQTGSSYLLCRCGHSKNMPFCDVSHRMVNFNGTETASREKFDDEATVYEGKNLNLKDNYELCSVARFCDRAGQIWHLIEKDDKESEKIAIEEACDCPSGRLVISEKDGVDIEPKLEQEISLLEDPGTESSGPIFVKGGIEIKSADGSTYEKRNRVTLCRCGNSKNKPFCDGTHIEIGFQTK